VWAVQQVNRQKGLGVPMRKQWAFPLLIALALMLALGGSAPPALATLFPLASGSSQCLPESVIFSIGGPGTPAIQPHLPGIPAFAAADARAYLVVNGVPGWSHFTITNVRFLTDRQVCGRAQIKRSAQPEVPDAQFCYVEVWGISTPISRPYIPNAPPLTARVGTYYVVFDARTGNLLAFTT
jgi:hypothetical protein